MPASSSQHVPSASIRIDGQELDARFMNNLKEVTVKEAIGLPATAQVVLADPKLKLVDDALLALGKDIEVGAGDMASHNPRSIFKGVIVALEPTFESGATTMVIRAYDKGQRLTRGTRTRTFLNMTVSDVVDKVGTENGLSTDVDPTQRVYEYLVQADESDWDLLERLARENDRELSFRDGTLRFKEVQSRGFEVELKFGESLLSFAPRASFAQQAAGVSFRGFDVAGHQAAVGEQGVSSGGLSTTIGLQFNTLQTASQEDDGKRSTVVSVVPGDHADLRPLSRSLAARIAESAVEAEGVSLGDPRLRSGTRVKVDGVGTRFGGDYTLSSVTHVFRGGSGYRTRFGVSGRSRRTLRSLMGDGGRPRTSFGDGLVVGVVTNTNDPDKHGRVKVKFPALGLDNDREVESAWARVATLNAGNGRGMMFLPEVDDEVVVGFEHGDMRRPYVLGSVFNGRNAPSADLYKGGGKTDFDAFLRIDTPRGFFMRAKEPMELKTDKKYTLEAGEEITIKSTGKSIEITSGGGQPITIKAGGDVTVEGQQAVTIKATTKVDIQAKAQVNVQASGPVNVKGAMVNLG